MDCHRCLAGDAVLTRLSYPDGDSHRVFLCERCIEAFEADATVSEVAVAQRN